MSIFARSGRTHYGGGRGPTIGTFRQNRPAGWTNSAPLDFSQTPTLNNPNSIQIGTSLWNQDFFGPDWATPADSSAPVSPSTVWQGTFRAGSYGEAHTIPASGPFTVTATYAANYGSTQVVWDSGLNFQYTPVASNPGLNQYSVTNGVYTFNSGNTGQSVLISYFFATTAGIPSGSTATGTALGTGLGKLYCATPSGASRMYLSVICYFDLPDATYWHPISNKFITIFCNVPGGGPADLLVQLYGNGNYLSCNAEDGSNFNLDATHGQISNNPIALRQWHEVEVLIDLPNKTWKVWLDGVLTSANTSVPFVATSWQDIDIVPFRGGGGETLAADLHWRFDDVLLVW